MNMKAFIWIGLAAIIAPAHAFAVPAPKDLLPKDTLGFITIPDVSTAKARFAETAMGQLWQDPAMKPFRKHLQERLSSRFVKPFETKWDVELGEYLDLLQGQITLALTPNEWADDPKRTPGLVFLLDAGKQQDELGAKLDEFRQRWVEADHSVKKTRIRDVTFTTLIIEPEDKKEPLNIFMGQSGSLLLVSNSKSDLEKLLITLDGGMVPTLDESSEYQDDHANLFQDAPFYGWLNFGRLSRRLQKLNEASNQNSGSQKNANPFPIDKAIQATGLSSLSTVAITTTPSNEGTMGRFFLGVPSDQRRGLFKILSLPQKEAGPPAFVPDDVLKYSRWRIDTQETWDAIEDMLTGISPQIAGVFKLMVKSVGKKADANFDLETDLIGNMGDDFISFEKPPEGSADEPSEKGDSLTLIGSANPERLARALKLSAGLLPSKSNKVNEREFLGRTIYSLALKTPRRKGSQGGSTSLHFAASASYVALSTDPATLEAYLRDPSPQGQSLRSLPGLDRAAEKVGGMSQGFFGYENSKASTKHYLKLLREDGSNLRGLAMLSGALLPRIPGKGDHKPIDFSLLPPFEKVAKYFHFSVYATESRPEGIYFNLFSPKPPALQ